MRANEVVSANLKKQRNFIERQLRKIAADCNFDGDPSYPYTGYIFPANIQYFEDIGFNVIEVKNEMLVAKNNGRPTYLFTPKNSLVQTDEDMSSSEFPDHDSEDDLNTDKNSEDELTGEDEPGTARRPILRGMIRGIPVIEVSGQEDLQGILQMVASMYGIHVGSGNLHFNKFHDGPQDKVHFTDPDDEMAKEDDGVEDDLPDTF